jgi:hypothetical protein
MKVKRGKIAKRQMKLKREEEAWIAEMLKSCEEDIEQHNAQTAERADSHRGVDVDIENSKISSTVTVQEITPE